MNPRLIRLIILLMFMAMTGLVGIQIYWIREAVDQREQQFSQGVFDALSNVVIEYEKKRIEHDLEKMLNWQSIENQMQSHLDSLNRTLTPEEKRDGKILREITINVTKPSGHAWYKHHQLDGQTNHFNMTDPFSGTYTDPMTGEVIDTADEYFQKLDKNYELLAQKGDLLGNLFKEMLTGFLSGYSPSYDSLMIDSILANQLAQNGIHTSYDFGIYDVYQHEFELARTHEKTTLANSTFRIPMTMNPYFDEHYLIVYFPNKAQYLLKNIWFLLLASAFLILIIIFSFAYTINIIFRQKKVQDIKNDLINNITHELKTPISTISLACQAMNDPDLMNSGNLRNTYVTMIDEENKRLGLLVENVLQSAVMDKGEYKLKIRKVDINARIEKVLGSLTIQMKNKNVRLVKSFKATEPAIEGDEVMLTNLIFNILDNAIKYSKGTDPYIELVTRNEEQALVLEIADNGIGISKDDQKRIFEKLYRVPTGNVHNVKGYGLGLSYVKSIVERHHGTIQVKSQLGEGSRFIIKLPLKQNTINH